MTGRPSEASAGEGAALLRALGEDLAAALEKARVEQPPIQDSPTQEAF